ncbi:MAG: hypothetical protein ACAH80_10950 [Alphaproteobacteria bacterium]
MAMLSSVDAAFFADKELLTKPAAFIAVPAEDDCEPVRSTRAIGQAENAEKMAARKARLDKAASAEDMLEELGKMPASIEDPREIVCGSIEVKPGGLLALAMPWGSAYAITGSQGLSIKGQMINPLDVNSPETFQFAQNGDKATRYILAVHNIGTGQNLKLALRWLKEAAEQGYRPAILQLSECYETGKCGVAKDAKEALFWHALGRGDIEPDGELYKRLEDWKKAHPEVTDY